LADIAIQQNYTIDNTNVIFMELYAIKDIEADAEITINYGPVTAHNRDFKCGCLLDFATRLKIFIAIPNKKGTFYRDIQ